MLQNLQFHKTFQTLQTYLIMFIAETHATSHIGRVRKGNEDNYLMLHITNSNAWIGSQDPGDFIIESQQFEIDYNGIILAVSDGMGGALAGEVASQMAVETVSQIFLEEDPEKTISPDSGDSSLIGRLYDATIYANHLIHQHGRSDPQYNGMGATFTAIGITGQAVDFVQVGDSRGYLIRNGQIEQLTKDQSLVQQLIDAGQIKPEEAETHQFKNVILQALGAQNEIYPVASRLKPQQDDVILLCSDGLSNKISSSDMLNIISQHQVRLEMAAAQLVKLANENGGEDNITLVIVKLSGDDIPKNSGNDIELELMDFGNIHDTADQDTGDFV